MVGCRLAGRASGLLRELHGQANAKTNVTGTMQVRELDLTHATVTRGRISIAELGWNNPPHASAWFMLAPVAGLLENPDESLKSLILNAAIEEVAARIRKNNASVRLTAGQLRLHDGVLSAAKLKGLYGKSSSLTNVQADWKPLFSKRSPNLNLELAAKINLADDIETLMPISP